MDTLYVYYQNQNPVHTLVQAIVWVIMVKITLFVRLTQVQTNFYSTFSLKIQFLTCTAPERRARGERHGLP